MGQSFLSDGWFDEVKKITEAAGDLEIPDAIKDIKINLVVSDAPDGTIDAHIAGGSFGKGGLPDASTSRWTSRRRSRTWGSDACTWSSALRPSTSRRACGSGSEASPRGTGSTGRWR